MKKLFISMAIVCTFTYPAAENSSIWRSHKIPDEPMINRSSGMTLYNQILTKFTKDLFFKELEQIRKQNPALTDPQELIRLAYAKVEEQSGENAEDLIVPFHFGLSIRDLSNHNLMPKYSPEKPLSKLDFSNMYINDLDGLQDLPGIQNIQNLSLNNNRLKKIPLSAFIGLTNLRVLNLQNNQLQTIAPNAFADLSKLAFLNLNNNQLQIIHFKAFANLVNLKQLNLRENQLQTISSNAFVDLSTLTTLNLGNNQLQTIPSNIFAKLNKLDTINLSNNQLQTIPPKAFTNLVNLLFLYLNNNQLQTIPSKALADLVHLEYLFLNNNQLKTIIAGSFAGLINLKRVFLNENHITNLEEQHRIQAEIETQSPMAWTNLTHQTPPPASLTDDTQNAKRGRKSVSDGRERQYQT